jgi:carbonic anhydrase/nucleoid-associated protein YgaU
MADALLWQATQTAGQFGVPAPTVALQNGGGIRNNNVIPAGPFTELNTFDIAPFANYATVVEGVSPTQFKEIMENAVSQVEEAGGRFAQIAGFTLVYDRAGTAQAMDDDGNIVTPGTRVQSITLADGTAIVQDGAVVEGAPAVNVATIDFLAQGGDQYPFGEAKFTPLGVSYQEALRNYITEALGGTITADKYPDGGEGRITAVGETAPGSEEAEVQTEGAAPGCAEDYTVQADDWLSKIADKFYGDILAYPVIFDATNAAAAQNDSYAVIADPDVIEVGQVLCIPSADEVAALSEGETAAATEETTEMAETAEIHWGYSGEIGPEFWGSLSEEFALCSSGTSQSPIDISGVTPSSGGITFNYQPTSLGSVVNNGHTIQVNYDPGSSIEVDGVQYDLFQFHFHTPSENTQDGAAAPMEVHLVHRSAEGTLAVVGVWIDAGEENPVLAQFWDSIPAEEGEVAMEGSLNVADLVPVEPSYYAFSGSLTTPPCTEGVNWFMVDQRITASQAQIDAFTAIIGENARPVQPLNDRLIRQ